MIYQRRKGALVQMENVQSKKSLAEELGIEMDEKNFTPMVKQYLSIKEKNRDYILLFRIGDFYEMFFDDAKIASQELQLFLTKKGAGNGTKIPMCGIPHHAYLSYAQKLLDNGHKVAIVEQLEDPALTKKLVKRGIIQVITPGANLDLRSPDNNFIASLTSDSHYCSIVYADMSTGEIFATNTQNDDRAVLSKLMALEIKELVLRTSVDADFVQLIKENSNICISYCNNSNSSIELEPLFANLKDPKQILSLTRLMNYLTDTQKRELDYFKPAINILSNQNMSLDYSTLVNLELLKSLDGKHVFGTLYWLLNHCSTPMGSRFLKSCISEPLCNLASINDRLDCVDWLVKNYVIRQDLIDSLSNVYDLDRLIARISYGSSNGHDMLQLKKSLKAVPSLKKSLENSSVSLLESIRDRLSYFDPLINLLEKAVREDCPLTITEGGIFKDGYDQSLDDLLSATQDSRKWINELETREKERTGIKNLRVGFTKAFGYYIEVSKGNVPEVKPEFGYIRKQTLTTGERYTTEELQQREQLILNADDLKKKKEYELFQDLRKKVSEYTHQIQDLSQAIALLDYLVSISVVSSSNAYVRPVFNVNNTIDVKGARHPVIEKAQPEREFVSNDYKMDSSTEVLIITGPNMGGKSTYMREFALIAIMAQMGMYVPAQYCSIPVFDSIFTRIGASDDLIKGASTFMVEMQETNKALSLATSSSLILFDEIGRGTATYDGMALAQAILEYVISKIHAKTFFSTHYHELTALSNEYKQMKNVHVSVTEENDKVTFLYKVTDGPMDKSYGINVAQLAGMPDDLLYRATDILKSLEENGNKGESIPKVVIEEKKKNVDPIIDKLKNCDPMNMSPLDALNLIYTLHKEASGK